MVAHLVPLAVYPPVRDFHSAQTITRDSTKRLVNDELICTQVQLYLKNSFNRYVPKAQVCIPET